MMLIERSNWLRTEMNSTNEFTPNGFIGLLARERRWIELLIAAILTRDELRSLGIKLLADDSAAAAFQTRARWLRN